MESRTLLNESNAEEGIDTSSPVSSTAENKTHCRCGHSHEMDTGVESRFSNSIIVLIARLVLAVMVRFWRVCTTGLLILLLFYWLYGSLVALGLLLTAILGVLYNAQDMLLYHPTEPENSRIFVESPAILSMPFENTFILTSDRVRLNLIIIKQNAPLLQQAPTFVFFHGNAGNIGHRLMNAYGLFTFCRANVMLVEYRGYGKSSGRPSESGMYCDAEAVLDFIFKRQDINRDKIYIFGRSLGGAVALYAATLPLYASRIAGVIVENTFTSIPAIGYHILKFKVLKVLPEFCYKNVFPSLKRIKKVRTPTLFISGLADTLIPPSMMKSLYQESGSLLKRMARFEGGTHNETWQCNGYYESMVRFTQEVEEFRRQGHMHNSAPSGEENGYAFSSDRDALLQNL